LSLAIYLQIGLGYTPIHAALTTVPSSVGLILASVISTKLVPRPGRVLLASGAVIMAVAIAGLIVAFNHYGAAVTSWELRPMIFVLGLGMGLTIPPLADAIIAHIPERVAGAASGLINSGLQVGNAIGVAVIGVILFSVLGSHAPTSARTEAAKLSAQLSAQGVPASERQQITAEYTTCFVDASRQKDPAAVPESCRKAKAQGGGTKVSKEFAAAIVEARKDNFSVAIGRAVGYALAAFLAAGILLLFLNPKSSDGPGGRRRYAARHAARRGPPTLAA
jgi:MFS family permease